jgi:hypothetical protein
LWPNHKLTGQTLGTNDKKQKVRKQWQRSLYLRQKSLLLPFC